MLRPVTQPGPKCQMRTQTYFYFYLNADFSMRAPTFKASFFSSIYFNFLAVFKIIMVIIYRFFQFIQVQICFCTIYLRLCLIIE
jgi:hypothetical protein